jgi:hypothetical protein
MEQVDKNCISFVDDDWEKEVRDCITEAAHEDNTVDRTVYYSSLATTTAVMAVLTELKRIRQRLESWKK